MKDDKKVSQNMKRLRIIPVLMLMLEILTLFGFAFLLEMINSSFIPKYIIQVYIIGIVFYRIITTESWEVNND